MGRLGSLDAGTVSRTIQEGKIMSYTVTSQGGKRRPATVTAASALLYLCALVEVVALVLSVLAFSRVSSVLNQEFAGKPEAQVMKTGLIIGVIIGTVIPVLLATGRSSPLCPFAPMLARKAVASLESALDKLKEDAASD